MTTTIDTTKRDALVDRVFGDFATSMTLPLVRLGDRLGLYRKLAELGGSSAFELAEACGLPEPVVHEWLANQAAAGYIDVELATERFSITPEQAAVFVDEASGVNMLAAFQLAAAYTRSEPALADALRSWLPYRWGDHDKEVFDSVARFYRPAYEAALVSEWIAAIDGVEEHLRSGATVADVGCGFGISTVIMAEAFPASRFVGIDDHAGSIDRARKLAADRGVADRATFNVRAATHLAGTYDFIVVLDAFHDMGEPESVAERLRDRLAGDGVCMLVEPFAADTLEGNMTPLGRVYYAASTLACTPSALSQANARPLGAQAGPSRLVEILTTGGFRTVRVAATTPFNIVLEARP